MDEVAIINSSPLIFLGRAGRLSLLKSFFYRCVVPEPVRLEIWNRGKSDPAVQALLMNPWIEMVPSPTIMETITRWNLGVGESSVLALALASPQDTCVVVDDLAARRCAAALGIPVRGTLGIVLTAKKRGIIPLARPVMEELIARGMYLSRHVLDQALMRVGE